MASVSFQHIMIIIQFPDDSRYEHSQGRAAQQPGVESTGAAFMAYECANHDLTSKVKRPRHILLIPCSPVWLLTLFPNNDTNY